MKSWLIYIGAFIAGLCGAFAAFLVVGGAAYDQLSDMQFIAVMLLVCVLSAFGVFVLVYAIFHQWSPRVKHLLLGLATCLALMALGGWLILFEVVGVVEGIGFTVLAAFCLGRYLTVKFANG